ncbi:MAG: hypothetical protein AAFY24_24785 [Pseudomonadota bacterium]
MKTSAGYRPAAPDLSLSESFIACPHAPVLNGFLTTDDVCCEAAPLAMGQWK